MEIEGFKCLADVTEKSVDWLWEGLLPKGELTVLEGYPATNKSSYCCYVAGLVTQGKMMPHTTKKGRQKKGGVVYLVGEDSVETTVVPRLRAAGADLAKVYVSGSGDVAIPDNLDRLEEVIRQIGATLVVVDTIDDFINASTVNNKAVRRVLGALWKLAAKMKVAVVLIRHLTKKSSGNSLLRGVGGGAITGVICCQLKLYRHPDDEHLRVLIQDKNRLGPFAPSLLFEVVSTDDGQFRLECRGETKLTIADLESSKRAPKLEAATKFLREKLADGPKEYNWLVEQSSDICSKRTLNEAKAKLQIVTEREGKGKNHTASWALPTVEEQTERPAKAAPKPKKPAAKTPRTKKPATQKPASKTPRPKSTKVQVPKLSKYDIFE